MFLDKILLDVVYLLGGCYGLGAIIILNKSSRDFIPVLFVLSIFLTHFYRVNVSGVALFPFYFTTVLVFISLGWEKFLKVLRTKIFLSFLFYSFWTLTVSIWREHAFSQIIATFGLRILLLLLSACVALILYENKINLDKLITLLFIVMLTNSLIGIVQAVTGTFALSAGQTYFLNSTGRPSGFFPEPDALGKFCMVLVLLVLPLTISLKKYPKKKTIFVLVLVIFTMLVSHTRSAWTGFLAGVLVLLSLSAIPIKKKVVLVSLLFLGLSFLYFSPDTLGIGDRISSLSSMESIENDNSGRYRLMTLRNAIYVLDHTDFGWVVGLGWFESGMAINHKDFSLPSNLFMFLIYRGGVIGLAFCLYAFLYLIYITARFNSSHIEQQLLFRGTTCAMVAMLVTSLLAPMWFDPLFWFVIGLGIYAELSSKHNSYIVVQKVGL